MAGLVGGVELQPVAVDETQIVLCEPPLLLPGLHGVALLEELQELILGVVVIQGVLERTLRQVSAVDRVDEC